MNLVRSLFLPAFCVQLSCLHSSSLGASAGSTLWGKKLEFKANQCLWQLHPETVIPALEQLSVCMLLRRSFTTEWTGFVYKAPGSTNITLGLQGKDDQLTVWLFGHGSQVAKKLNVKEWHSICITWSGRKQLRLYINGTCHIDTTLEASTPPHLTPNGTLTLGLPHFVVGTEVKPENGKSLIGDISRFRIWAKEWSAEELTRQKCTDGDVVSWDLRHWKNTCSPMTDSSLQCEWSSYKVKMRTIVNTLKNTDEEKCSLTSLKNITKHWLERVFPSNISVNDISVSSSHTCGGVNHSTALHVQQESQTLINSVCNKCFLCEVYVNVEPAVEVEMVQADITARLSSTFSFDFLKVTADPASIRVLSVDSHSSVTARPTTVHTVSSSGVWPTQSMPADPDMTDEPLDINKTFDKPDLFFRVNLTLSITGSPSNPQDFIKTLVNERLALTPTMKVLNLLITETTNRIDAQYGGLWTAPQKRYNCTFHVQEDYIYNVSEVQRDIKDALTFSFTNDSVKVATINLETRHIVPPNCLEDKTKTIYGTYFWPTTFPQDIQSMRCQNPSSETTFRLCKLETTDTTKWAKPDMSYCIPRLTIPDIENVNVTTDNAADVVEMIQDLVNVQLSNSSQLSSEELDTVVGKLSEVVDVGTSRDLGANIVTVMADILVSDTNVSSVSNIVLNLTSKMGDTMDFQGATESITAPSMALSLCNVDSEGFTGLTFGVSSVATNLEPQVFVDQKFVSDQIPNTEASISLPPEVQNFFSQDRNTSRVQFQFYATDELFQDPYTLSSKQGNITLNSYIVLASLNNSNVRDLTARVVVDLIHHKSTQQNDEVYCVFWDFQKNGGHGGWNRNGCETQSVSDYQTRCLCDHLTHFALLLDVSRTPISEVDSWILTVLSYIGCGISSIFLGITLLTYLAFEKLRRDNPSKILINLSSALLGLCMLFLLDSWLSSFSNYSLCIATAAILHYFLLASFAWMGLEALHMYLALVKVFNIYVPSYILKFCAVGWGIPLVIVSLVLAIDKDAYGSYSTEDPVGLQSSDPFCWVQDDIVFYVTVVGFIVLILLANLSVFIVVLIQIKHMRTNKLSANSKSSVNDLRAVASLTVLLGLTWSMGFFSFGPGRVAMMYLFSILNSLQGFFVFFFHCWMKDNVRKQWRMYLCCGPFRLSDYSDWTHTATGRGQSKKKTLVNSDSDASNITTTRKISEASS